jgi:hypothetical protein
MKKRPLSVTLIGCLYIAVGAIESAFQLAGIKAHGPYRLDIVWVELVCLLAILSGVYVLRGHNWARWLAIAWIAFHVAVSAFHALRELAVHSLLLVAITYLLFRSTSTRYFRPAKT